MINKEKYENKIVIKDDYSHCCPHGYTCDVEENKCQKGISIPWFTKKAATPLDLPSKLITFSHSLSSISTIQCPG